MKKSKGTITQRIEWIGANQLTDFAQWICGLQRTGPMKRNENVCVSRERERGETKERCTGEMKMEYCSRKELRWARREYLFLTFVARR